MNFKKVFPLETTDENGNGITFNNAKGITVTEEKMYICDTDNKRILIYGKNGGFIRTVNAPESSLLGEDFIFQPTKVAVVNKGNLALKYQLAVNGINGDAKLLEVISFAIIKADGTAVDLAVFEDTLKAADQLSEIYYIEGHMDEDAGNEYQELVFFEPIIF